VRRRLTSPSAAGPFRLPVSPPVFADDVVHLRLLTPLDTDVLVSGSRDPDVVRWTFLPPRLDTAGAALMLDRWQSLIRDGRARQYVVAAAADPSVPLGLASLILQDAEDPSCVDVAYWLLPAGRGRGLMTHAVGLLLSWAFSVAHCGCAALHTKKGNAASEAVARRCGFSEVGRRTWNHDGRRIHLRRWTRGASAAPAGPSRSAPRR
jgi:RimJ/RimL family protein N-acetyltransferase